MKKRNLWGIIAILLISLSWWFVPSVKADNIAIDGNFNDWNTINKASFGYYHLGNWAISSDQNNIYVYIDNGGYSDIQLPKQNYTLKVGDNQYNLELSGADSQLAVTARDENNSWKSLGTVGIGKLVINAQRQTLEFSVALTKLGITNSASAQSISLSNSNLGSQTASSHLTNNSSSSSSAASSSSSSSSSVTSTSSSTASSPSSASTSSSNLTNTNTSGNLGITIDGKFSDWDDKTKFAMKINGDDDNIKYASLLTDDNYIYFYIRMNPVLYGGYTDLQSSGYDLTVGGVTYNLNFGNHYSGKPGDNGPINLPVEVYQATHNYDNKNAGEMAAASEKITQKMGDGSKVDGWGTVLEVRIPFSALKYSSKTSGQVITLANRNLWSGEITASGGSTGPFVLALIGFGVAVAALLLTWKKKKGRSNLRIK